MLPPCEAGIRTLGVNIKASSSELFLDNLLLHLKLNNFLFFLTIIKNINSEYLFFTLLQVLIFMNNNSFFNNKNIKN